MPNIELWYQKDMTMIWNDEEKYQLPNKILPSKLDQIKW